MVQETELPVLSHVQAETLLRARKEDLSAVTISPDLGISQVAVELSDDGVTFPGGAQIGWKQVEKIRASENNCFVLEEAGIRAIQFFSEETNRMCSLLPTKSTPTMLIAGFTMHRIVDTDPLQDTMKKIAGVEAVSRRGF